MCPSVCPSACPSVHLSVCPSQRKSAITFEPLDWQAQNFQDPLTSSQIIFGRVTQTPRPSGSSPDPKKGVSGKSISSGDFGAWGSCRTFSESGQVLAHSRRKRSRKAGLAGGRPKFFNFKFFLYKWPPLKLGTGRFLPYATFWSDAPWGPHGYPEAQGGGENQKSNLGYFLKKGPPTKSNSKNILFVQLFYLTQPWGSTGRSKSSKKGPDSRFAKLKFRIWVFCNNQDLKGTIKH